MDVGLLWMVVRRDETGCRNIVRNGEGLSESVANARVESLMRRRPVGQTFEALSYTVETRVEMLTRKDISEYIE